MKVAEVMAGESKAKRLQVGAVITKNGRIISTGWNGTPSGFDNNCEDENGITKKEVAHAEANAIFAAAKVGISTQHGTMFCTHACCVPCAVAIISSGIRTVYYRHAYRDSDGLRTLFSAGIKVEQI